MESEITQYVSRAENAELKIQELVKELEALEKGLETRHSNKSMLDTPKSNTTNQGNFELSHF